jgi:hypothetical protein
VHGVLMMFLFWIPVFEFLDNSSDLLTFWNVLNSSSVGITTSGGTPLLTAYYKIMYCQDKKCYGTRGQCEDCLALVFQNRVCFIRIRIQSNVTMWILN